ncbi:MAG: hypothetical protein RBG1_1C00001G1013 [candidate division Zixibacteria bacterium RBG-1]|nr:MAG: hypothetical protein RBG1_1C00001G1013 [candidate division Zixibacteria bacterium RBG-1]OGC85738.1 MAG: hypothetical protein A2V73_01505 [candidate division Zixibacteria bacterium RBG_19FT_COMBO_42_43]
MTKAELHNPSNLKLPPLKIIKNTERQRNENDSFVKTFIRSKLLLDYEFNKLYLEILEQSKEIRSVKIITETELFKNYPYSFGKLFRPVKLEKLEDYLHPKSLEDKIIGAVVNSEESWIVGYKNLKQVPDKKREEFSNSVLKTRRKINNIIRQKICKLSSIMLNAVSAFEDKRKTQLSILSATVLQICKKCSAIISFEKFKVSTCTCGDRIVNTSQVTQAPIYYFNDSVINFLEKNCWFEHGVAHLLHKKNIETLVGVNVLGHSGVWHEIDVIAESRKNHTRFFCECKNTNITESDVFIFSGKMIDVGCTRGYIFTTSESDQPNIIRLARAKNIDIISSVFNKDKKILLEAIKEN